MKTITPIPNSNTEEPPTEDQLGDPHGWSPPEDRSQAVLTPLGDIEYVEDLVRPGQIIVIAAEEGTGKSMAFPLELGIRLAVAGGRFADTWEIREHGPVVYLSEMSSDEDYRREEMILTELGIPREALEGRYFRQSMNTVMHGLPVLDSEEWIDRFIEWSRRVQPIALFIDTATMATDAEPWGSPMRQVIRNIRQIQEAIPKLATFPIVHFKKPQGRGTAKRGLSDVMGEWGRPSDGVILLHNEPQDKVRISTHKRIQNHRNLLLTKRNGLLVDPVDLTDAKAPAQKVSNEGVLAAIQENPGITARNLAKLIDVAPSTASGYIEKLADEGLVEIKPGPHSAKLAYATDEAPEQLPWDTEANDAA